MTIDLYGDDVDQWKCPKPFPRKSPRGFMPKYGQKFKISLNHLGLWWNLSKWYLEVDITLFQSIVIL